MFIGDQTHNGISRSAQEQVFRSKAPDPLIYVPDIAELVLPEGTPDQETIDNVEGYLAWKWGLEAHLPAGHPCELAAPLIPEPATLAVFELLVTTSSVMPLAG